ncbi:MAG: lacto-N-biose phosphorylase central domain-containing protein [Planctomycetota bacterium]
MKRFVLFLLLLCVRPIFAAENWFLPYEPDDKTIALFHLDGDEEEQRSAAKPEISITFQKDAAHDAGRFGKGAKLNGHGAVLRLSKNDAFLLKNDQEFTVELWCKPATNDDAGLISIGTRFYLHITPGQRTATFGYRAASFPIRYSSMANIPIRRGQWNHVALTHDKNRVARIYVNGQFAGETAHKDEGDYPKGGGGSFGAHDGWSKFFEGWIDEIRISDCIREFRPIVTQRSYLPGEQLQLALDVESLPDAVQSATIVVRAGRESVFEKTIPRAELGRPIADASVLPEAKGAVEVTFLTADGASLATASKGVAFAGKTVEVVKIRLTAMKQLIDATRDMPDMAARVKGLALFIDRIEQLIGQRDFAAVEGHLKAAERIAHALQSGETTYRAAIRRHVRSGKSDKDIRVTMSWRDEAEGAFPWAERIGANELVGSAEQTDPATYDTWRKKGYLTAALCGIPIHDASWLKDHPEQRQYGFWRMDPAKAEQPKLDVKIVSPSWGGHTHIDDFHEPKDHWKVIDVDDRNVKPEWSYDKKTCTVTITNAVPGHSYLVYFMFTNIGVGDPLFPPFEKRALENLESVLKPAAGRLQVYWFDDLGFAYPGPTPQGAWDWESYSLAARPENQKLFTEETGIAFDPEWLVMPPKTIEVAPDPRYLAWMGWVRARVEKWMVKPTDLVRKHSMKSWLYWGDCHVGIEPFLGGLAAGKVEQIDKPCSDPVTARALVDFPGENVYRRLRVQWLYDHLVPTAKCGDNLAKCWRGARRGLLMDFPSAIYWMPFDCVATVGDKAIQEDDVETIAEISDEFMLLGRYLNGKRAFNHDITLYVINSWGKVYSWRPWGAARLEPLTDLPINVKFISLGEIAKNGVPADAHVLLNYGQPNSSWSGGHFWKSPELKAAIEAFVRKGGGFIGMESPSHCDEPKPQWALNDLIGVVAEGAAEFKPDLFDQSMLADTALQAPEEEKPTARLSKTKAAHWISEGQPAHLVGMVPPTRVAATAEGAVSLFAASDKDGKMSPGVVARQVGEGRCIYFASYSQGYDFYRLFRRAIFWAAKAEYRFGKLDIAGANDIFVYAYPSASLIALLNSGAEKATATLACDPAIFNLKPDAKIALRDAVTNDAVFSGEGSHLCKGIPVEVMSDCVVLLNVVKP